VADILIKWWHFIMYLLSWTWWHFRRSYLSQAYFRSWTDVLDA